MRGRYPLDKDIDARRAALKAATEKYLRDNGKDASLDVLKFGDKVDLVFAAPGTPRYMVVDKSGAVCLTSDAESSGGWIIVNPDASDSTETIRGADKISLRSQQAGSPNLPV